MIWRVLCVIYICIIVTYIWLPLRDGIRDMFVAGNRVSNSTKFNLLFRFKMSTWVCHGFYSVGLPFELRLFFAPKDAGSNVLIINDYLYFLSIVNALYILELFIPGFLILKQLILVLSWLTSCISVEWIERIALGKEQPASDRGWPRNEYEIILCSFPFLVLPVIEQLFYSFY